MDVVLRDCFVYLFTLSYLIIILWDLEVTFWESFSLVCFYPLYVIYCTKIDCKPLPADFNQSDTDFSLSKEN